MKTEDRVYPVFGINDLDEEAIEYMRLMVKADNPDHEWLKMDNEAMLRSGQMIMVDPETGKEGLTLAGILLFGKRNTIASVLPQYSIDVLCRVRNTELYDDRVLVKENLMVAYRQMMAFIQKHLPEKPYIEGMQRFSLRDKIMREVCLNMLIHREYSSAYPTTLTIWGDRIETENWNVPYVYGRIDLQTLKPHRKNPTIANVFSQMGIVEELGSGTKKMFKYTPLFSGGKEPVIEEQDVYRITIPCEIVTDINRHQTDIKPTTTDNEWRVLELLRDGDHSLVEIMQVCGYKDRDSFRKAVLNQMLEKEWVNMTHPENLRHRGQKYFLTEKGKDVLS